MRRFVLVAVVSILVGGVVAPAPISAAAPRACRTAWGVVAETELEMSSAPIIDVRAGQSRCYDRLVIEVDGDAAGFRVRYARRIIQDGSGIPLDVEGRARLSIVILAPAYDDDGNATIDPDDVEGIDITGFRSFRDIVWAGSFEGQTTIGLGLRKRLPFRVFVLDGPGPGARIIIDVARRAA